MWAPPDAARAEGGFLCLHPPVIHIRSIYNGTELTN